MKKYDESTRPAIKDAEEIAPAIAPQLAKLAVAFPHRNCSRKYRIERRPCDRYPAPVGSKKPRGYGVLVVAPTGIEPVFPP